MSITLHSLDLGPAEHVAAENVIRQMAYLNWLDTGRRDGCELDCWLSAEREWIEHCYVPNRPGAESRQPFDELDLSDDDNSRSTPESLAPPTLEKAWQTNEQSTGASHG